MNRKDYANKNITVEVVADSVNPEGKRITSMLWTYPRFIHAEIMTHRALSRNAASSRAIPVKKVIEAVRENPARPEWWGKAQGGMQADARFEPGGEEEARLMAEWEFMRELTIGGGDFTAVPTGLVQSFSDEDMREGRSTEELIGELSRCRPITGVQGLMELGLHKQIANRPLEPWFHITVLVTATEWENFYGLRAHKDAQPEFQVLAYRSLDRMLNSTPEALDWREWHLPFDPGPEFSLEERKVVSVAKAARTSYVAFDADKSMQEQYRLYDFMRSQGHWSPFEHQAQADEKSVVSGNLRGFWLQLRHTFPDQVRRDLDYHQLMADKPDWIAL